MTVQGERDDSPEDADEPTLFGGQPPRPDVGSSNTVTNAVVHGSTVQAHKVTGGVHVHQHPTPPPRPVPQQLPPAPRGFVGRVDHLADLDIPSENSMVVISAIGGTGGIGKTWLALTWAHRNLHQFPDGQLFVDLHGFSPIGRPAYPTDVLGGFLEALGVDRDRQPTDPDRRAALYRSLVADKRVLVVLDNAATTDQVTSLLPGGHRCTVLITSRNHLHGLITRYGARPVHLNVLTDTEAHALMTSALGRDKAEAETQAIEELIRLCGGFPLALGLIAARAAADPHLPLRDAVAELHALGTLDSGDPTASLSTVLSWSLDRLTDQQRTVFALLGIAPGPDIGLPAAASLIGLPERETHAVLRALADASLIDRTPGGRYALHDLVRAYATTRARNTLPETVRRAALERVVDFYLHTAHIAHHLLDPLATVIQPKPAVPGVHPYLLSGQQAAMTWLDTEHRHLLAAQVTATIHRRHITTWHLARALTVFHRRRGHRHADLAMWKAALTAATHLPDPATRIRAHRHLGRAHTRLSHHEQATEHLRLALAMAETHHNAKQQANAHHDLALMWARRGDEGKALDHARHALSLYRTLDDPGGEAMALNQVGWYTACQGEYDIARDHCQAALSLYRHHPDPDGTAATLDSLGYIDHHTSHHHQAIDHYQQALAQRRITGNTYQVANTLDAIGHPYSALSQHKQARTAWRDALQLYEDQGRTDDAARVQQQLDDLDRRNTDAPTLDL